MSLARLAILVRTVESVGAVFFVENLTIGDRAALRFLAPRDGIDATRDNVQRVVAAAGGTFEDVATSDAMLEDLFTRLTRGSEQILQVGG